MNCIECNKNMKLIYCEDTCTNGIEYQNKDMDIAFNIYVCSNCMMVAKEDVWDNKGIVWIGPTNEIEFTTRQKNDNNS